MLKKRESAIESGYERRGWRELTLINIPRSKNESETKANFMGQLIMALSNYTREFTNDFLGADSRRKRDNTQPSDAANSPKLTN